MVWLALISLVILFATDVWGFTEVQKLQQNDSKVFYLMSGVALVMYGSIFSILIQAI